MGFWKSLLAGSRTNTSSSKQERNGGDPGIDYTSIEFLTQSDQKTPRLFFSTDPRLDLYELEELCHSVGWARRPLHKVRKALSNSFLVVSLWEDRNNSKPRLIGFARATSDHAFNATVWDVAVRPSFQGKGLGKALMAYVVRKLRKQDISNITLFADPHVVEFYRNMGFVPDPEGIRGMFWYPD